MTEIVGAILGPPVKVREQDPIILLNVDAQDVLPRLFKCCLKRGFGAFPGKPVPAETAQDSFYKTPFRHLTSLSPLASVKDYTPPRKDPARLGGRVGYVQMLWMSLLLSRPAGMRRHAP
jgi:hypothetical protein